MWSPGGDHRRPPPASTAAAPLGEEGRPVRIAAVEVAMAREVHRRGGRPRRHQAVDLRFDDLVGHSGEVAVGVVQRPAGVGHQDQPVEGERSAI